jgi:flagellar biosynthetic protein FlhB
MSGQDASDKPFDPTPKKLADLRKRGEIAKSNDLITASAYLGFLAGFWLFGPPAIERLGSLLQSFISRPEPISERVFGASPVSLGGPLLIEISLAFGPLFALPAATAMTAVLAQRAFVVAPQRIAPKLNRINPISNAGSKFGRGGLFEFAKSFGKLFVFSTLLGAILFASLDVLISTARLDAILVPSLLKDLSGHLVIWVVIVSGAIAAADYSWQHAEHIRKNRMSRQEILDETKTSEGDPEAKQRRRQKAVEIATRQMIAKVPDADVIMVNPTHYAVALRWDRSKSEAPRMLAKGADHIAARIREIAESNGVPVHSDPPTTRALFATCEVGEEVHPAHYKQVAAAIRFADRIRKLARSR